MEATYYILEEASRLTGLSTEALRKRWMRAKLRGTKGNDGKVRVFLDDRIIEELREAGRPDVQDDGQEADGDSSTISALTRLSEVLEAQLALTRQDAVEARQEAAAARATLDREREAWLARMDRVSEQHAAALAELQDGRMRDRRAAMAAIERLKRALSEIREGQGTPVAPPPEIIASSPSPRRLLARIFRRS